MKNLIFFICLFPVGVFAQLSEEYLSEIPSNCKIYPVKNRRFSEYYGEFPFIQIKDSVTGKAKTIKNPKFQESVVEEYYNDTYIGSTSGYSLRNTYFNVSNPPVTLSLDSLEDGTYLYYYETVAYEEGDTLKFLENALCGIVPVKNNLLHGEVVLYYPNGLLLERITFENGRRNGPFFFQHLTIPDPTKKAFYRDYYTVESGTFKDDEIEGKFIKTTTCKLKNDRVSEEIEITHFKDKMRDGSYESQIDGKTLLKGRYRKGTAIGKWEIYQWEGEYGNSKLIPKLMFTIAENPPVYSAAFYHRKGMKESKTSNPVLNGSPTNFSEGGHHYLYNSWDQFPLQLVSLNPANQKASSITSYYKAIDCIVDSSGTNQKTYSENDWRSADHYTVDRRYVAFDEIEDSCGVVFPFENMAIYHPNGQLFLKYDFTQPEKLYTTVFYHSNGKILNQIIYNGKTWNYEESWFDPKGKLTEKYLCKPNGEIIEKVFPVEKMERNERTYKLVNASWEYHNNSTIDQNSSHEFIPLEILNKELETVYRHTYIPSEKKGFIIERSDFSAKINHTIRYSFSSDYHSVSLHDSINVGGLWITNDTVINFDPDDLIRYFLPEYNSGELKSEALIHVPVEQLAASQKMKLSNGLFSGTLAIEISETAKQQIKQSKKGFSMILHGNEFYEIQSFLTQTVGNKLYFNTHIPQSQYLPGEDQERKNLASYKLSKVHLVFEQGEIRKASLFAENGFPLQEVDFVKGHIKKFNEYPAIGFRYSNYRDSIYSYLSEEETFNQPKIHRINFNPKGDTIYAEFHTTGTNQINYKELQNDRTTTWTTENQNITRYQKIDTKTGIMEEQYNSENHSVEVTNPGTPRYVITYLSKTNVPDSIYCLDSLRNIMRQQYLVNGDGKELIYQEGLLRISMKYDSIEDWRNLSREQVLNKYRISGICNYYPDNLSNNNSVFLTKYDVYGKPVETGRLLNSEKTGDWNYNYPETLGHYTIRFTDTTVSIDRFNKVVRKQQWPLLMSYTEYLARTAQIAFYEPNGKIKSRGIAYEWNSEYSCTQNEYTEHYIIEYSFYNGKPTEGTTYNIVNYYPNGNKMNEGTIVNGKPEGLWKWYHSDGLLYEVGKYKDGMREGRWLKGDLSKVRFTADMCLDPNSSDFKEIMKRIEVTVEYYEKGLRTHSEYHELEAE